MKYLMVQVDNKELKLTNLDKLFWPGEKLNKAHLVKYYTDMAPYILPYIKDRPLVMNRYPDGINGNSFYQKECPSYAPDWIHRISIEHSEKIVNYIMCNDIASLVWLANQGCIEIHAWLSKLGNLDCPDIAVLDLDPAEGVDFKDVIKVALVIKKTLDFLKLESYIKTSGATGLHIFIPVSPEHSFKKVAQQMKQVAEAVVQAEPEICTVERSVHKRYGKVYIDYLQNSRGKTMAFPYSLRPLPGAPVSTPLKWEELKELTSPALFNINTIRERLFKIGTDPWCFDKYN